MSKENSEEGHFVRFRPGGLAFEHLCHNAVQIMNVSQCLGTPRCWMCELIVTKPAWGAHLSAASLQLELTGNGGTECVGYLSH